MSGAVPPPAARPLERAARVPRPVCPGCGRCGRVDPAPAPRRAPLRAGVARCGGGGRASPGGVPSTVVRGAWCQALSLPQLPVLWSGQPGFRDPCVPGAVDAGVWTLHRPHSVRPRGPALLAVGVAEGRPRGGVPSTVVRGAWCQALSLPRPPVLWSGQPGFRNPCVPGAVDAGVWALHRPHSVCPLRVGVARCGGGGRASPGGGAFHRCEGRLVSGAVPPPAARPLERSAGVPVCVCVRVRALLGRVGRAGLPGAFWCASPFSVAALSFCFAWPPPGWGCPPLSPCCCRSSLPWGFVLVVFFFFFVFSSSFFFLRAPPLSPAFSGFRPRVPRASALALFALLACRFSVLPALAPRSCFRLAVGCSLVVAAPPPPFVSRGFRRCRSVLCAVLCCASLGAALRVVSPGVVLSCAVLRSFGAAACCAVPSGAARRPGALCPAALCFAVFPRAVCSVLCVFCRGAVVRAVVRRAALCCACPGVLCCAFLLLSALCGALLRCAGALALYCSCGACCCWRLALWCAAVCCAVSCGVPWCGARSVGPWLFAGGVFRCRCPCLAAWSASLWLVWFAVVPCFPVSCSVVLCCRVVLCCCAPPSFCGAVGACFALLWAVVLCCVVLLAGCAVFCPVVVSACCGALFLVPCVPCLLPSVRCGALLCWLWCPASLCCVLWRCAVMWCRAVVLCCRCAVLFVFALPSCGLSCGACVVCAVVGASCCGVSPCVVVSPVLRCGGAALVCRGVLLCCALSCGVLRSVPCPAVPCCPAVLCWLAVLCGCLRCWCLFLLLSPFPLLKTPAVFPCL